MLCSPRTLTGLTLIVLSFFLSPRLAVYSGEKVGSPVVDITYTPSAMAHTKEYQELNVLREESLKEAIAMEEELYWRRHGHYIPCDQEQIHEVMKAINVTGGEENFVRSVLESYEQDEKDLHNIDAPEYLTFSIQD